jgi:uncharacterized protein YoxC
MEINQLDTTNIFLGIIAGLAVAQMVAGVIAVIWLRRTMSRVSEATAKLETTYLQPLVQESQQLARQTRQVISELQPLVARANTIVSGIGSRTEHAMMAVDAVNEQVDAVVHSGLNQLRAIEHGVRRGVETLVNFSNHR